MVGANFDGAGAGVKFSYFAELKSEPEPLKFLLAPAPSNIFCYIWKSLNLFVDLSMH